MPPELAKYLTSAKAATLLGTTPAEVERLADAGQLDPHEDDGRLYVSEASVQREANR